MRKRSIAFCTLGLLAVLNGSEAVQGKEKKSDATAIAPPEADRAAAIARENTGGRVLDVRLMADESPRSYAVRLLVDPGRVRTVVVDSSSGELR
jgi:uncharacterized membrane protein YkoI